MFRVLVTGVRRTPLLRQQLRPLRLRAISAAVLASPAWSPPSPWPHQPARRGGITIAGGGGGGARWTSLLLGGSAAVIAASTSVVRAEESAEDAAADDSAIVDEWFDLHSIEEEQIAVTSSVQFPRWAPIASPSTALHAFERYTQTLKPNTHRNYAYWHQQWYKFCQTAASHVAVTIEGLFAFDDYLTADFARRKQSLSIPHFCNMLSAISFLAQQQFCRARAALESASSPDEQRGPVVCLRLLQDPRPVFQSLTRQRIQTLDPFTPENLAALARYAPGGLKLRHFTEVCLRLLKRPRPDIGIREWALVTQLLGGLHRGHEVTSARLIQFGVIDEVRQAACNPR